VGVVQIAWGDPGFLLLHIPILPVVLYGLILIHEGSSAGLILSLLLSFGGIFAFSIHSYFLRKGRCEFDTLASKTIL
jgi:hypothetical protein